VRPFKPQKRKTSVKNSLKKKCPSGNEGRGDIEKTKNKSEKGPIPEKKRDSTSPTARKETTKKTRKGNSRGSRKKP